MSYWNYKLIYLHFILILFSIKLDLIFNLFLFCFMEKFYVQITEDGMNILREILAGQQNGITEIEVVEKMQEMNISRNVTYKFLKDALKDAREFLETYEYRRNKKGRPTKLLSINPERFITIPRTAKVLHAFVECQFHGRAIAKEDLIAFILRNYAIYKFTKDEIEQHLSVLEKMGEIGTNDVGLSVINWARLRLTVPWLAMMAERAYEIEWNFEGPFEETIHTEEERNAWRAAGLRMEELMQKEWRREIIVPKLKSDEAQEREKEIKEYDN